MSKMAISIVLAECLLLCAQDTAAAMTTEKMEQTAGLTADAETMWKALPTMASDAKQTATLIKDLEAFANLPASPKKESAKAAHQNCLEAVSWLKNRLPKQYMEDTKNFQIKAFSAPSEELRLQLIPKIIHFIWLGSPIPEKYLINIGTIAALNPDYQINIWLDDQSRASEGSLLGSRYQFRHVDQIRNHAVTPEGARNIYKLTVSNAGYKPNFAAASDLLRILILLAEGGVYLDTDTYIEMIEAAFGFGQLKARYGFLVSTQTLFRDGPFNNSPMAAMPGSTALRELLALADKRYRDATHVTQPPYGQGPESQSWLYWVATGSRDDMRLDSTCFLGGPGLVWDYLSRLGQGWLKAKNIELSGHVKPGPPAVELFAEQAKRVDYYCSSSLSPVENYFFIDNIYGDFDLTSETFGLSHKFDHSWLSQKALAEPVETKTDGIPGPAS
jgi:hypothetical protein